MSFENEYEKIKVVVQKDLNILETKIAETFSENTELNKTLKKFLTTPSKRLRPLLSFLYLRAVFNNITEKQMEVILAIELIHNATLIHDDIIDNSMERRQEKTLNAKFDNDFAVMAGDFLLTTALEKIINTENSEVVKLCTNALKQTCLGEVNQYFEKFKIPKIEQYLEKSKNKTALLFEIGITSGLILNDKKDLILSAKEFTQNFGIAFQIRDDLINVLTTKNIKENDIKSGIYTAPVIFASEENPNILKTKDIQEEIKKTQGIEKTKSLIDNCFEKSVSALKEIERSKYKKALEELTKILRKEK